MRITLVDEGNFAAEELAEMARQLLREIEYLPGTHGDFASGEPAPPGSKATSLVDLATLALNLPATAAAVFQLVQTVRDWKSRQPQEIKLVIAPAGGATAITVSGALGGIDPAELAAQLVQSLQPGIQVQG